MIKKSCLLIFLLVSGNALCAQNGIAVNHSWVREAPPGISVLAAYMIIENKSNKTRILTGVTSPQFKSVEIHRSVSNEGMMRMVPVKEQPIKTKERVVFQPGGLHLMLMQPIKRLKKGDSVVLRLHFKNAPSSEIKAPVLSKSPHPIEYKTKR